MAEAIVTFFLGLIFITVGVETLRGIRQDRPTPLNGLLPLRGRWMRIAWATCLFLSAALIGLSSIWTLWFEPLHLR